MSGQTKTGQDEIRDTLFLPLWARAIEMEKRHPALMDEFARQIIKTADFDFSRFSRLREINRIGWIARCLRLDRVINCFIRENPSGVIINLGCGLDTTYERIPFVPNQWYDLDLQEVIALRKRFFSEFKKRRSIARSFLDPGWHEEVSGNNRMLIVAMGVFPYFQETDIRDFIVRTINRFPGVEFFFDVTSGPGLKAANKVLRNAGFGSNTMMQWALNDKNKILSWDSRLQILATYYTFKINGLKMNLKNSMLAKLSDLLKIQYMLHLGSSQAL